MSKNKQTNEGQPAPDKPAFHEQVKILFGLDEPALGASAVKPAQFPFETGRGIGARPITAEQAAAILTAAEIEAGEKRGELKTAGPWQIPVSYKALAVSQDFSGEGWERYGRPWKVYGPRVLSNVRQGGHELEGRVSIGGKSYRGFTSSGLVELPGRRLVSVGVIHVCGLL
jgi:hypothetical protein